MSSESDDNYDDNESDDSTSLAEELYFLYTHVKTTLYELGVSHEYFTFDIFLQMTGAENTLQNYG
jgi:hypothetical protein